MAPLTSIKLQRTDGCPAANVRFLCPRHGCGAHQQLPGRQTGARARRTRTGTSPGWGRATAATRRRAGAGWTGPVAPATGRKERRRWQPPILGAPGNTRQSLQKGHPASKKKNNTQKLISPFPEKHPETTIKLSEIAAQENFTTIAKCDRKKGSQRRKPANDPVTPPLLSWNLVKSTRLKSTNHRGEGGLGVP